MAKNDFKAFATGDDANVIPQADYDALTARSSGFQSGIAKSAQLNKVWRQSSVTSAVLAQFVVDQTGRDAIDDGSVDALGANLKVAIFNDTTLTGAPTAPTPVQFDNSKRLVTSDWVVQNGLRMSTLVPENASRILEAADAKSFHAIQGNCTLTLPSLSSVASGVIFAFDTVATSSTIAAAAGDTITNGNLSTSVVLHQYETILLISGRSSWHTVGTTSGLGKNGSFVSSLAANGYQKLPSGLIIQWGYVSVAPTSNMTVTLPIVYPTANLGIACAVDDIATNGTLYRWTAGNKMREKITVVNNWNKNWISGSWISWGY